MNALLIIDLQNDFLPGGALPAPDGLRIVPVINRILKEFDVVVASKDWHPPNSRHFENWPPHCIRDTKGAEFPQGFHKQHVEKIFLKGTEGGDDGYSAFEANNADLQAYLGNRGVKHLFLAGLTTGCGSSGGPAATGDADPVRVPQHLFQLILKLLDRYQLRLPALFGAIIHCLFLFDI